MCLVKLQIGFKKVEKSSFGSKPFSEPTTLNLALTLQTRQLFQVIVYFFVFMQPLHTVSARRLSTTGAQGGGTGDKNWLGVPMCFHLKGGTDSPPEIVG